MRETDPVASASPRSLRDVLYDVTAVAISLAFSLGLVVGNHGAVKPYGGMTLVVLVATSLSLFVRRQAPLAVGWCSALMAAALPIVELAAPGTLLRTGDYLALGHLLVWPPTGAFVAYSLMSFADDRPAWIRWTPVCILIASALIMPTVLPNVPPRTFAEAAGAPSGVASRSVVFIGGGALLGMYNATRRRLVRGLVERAERAERERHLLAERARADERARLAAEMHDVVTHRVSLMVMQAGALRVTAADAGTQAAAEELRTTGCRALEELRDAVDLLRSESDWWTAEARMSGAPETSAPLPDLRPLIDESQAVGIPAELVEEGGPAEVSPTVGRTAYRVVQETLTNVRKHAPGSRVSVHVRYEPGEVRLTVRNTAPAGAPDPALAATGSGTGLLGLRQRVELVSGTLETGPEADGGFRVEAVLPTRPQG
jgi:signal transduction histidine kinase